MSTTFLLNGLLPVLLGAAAGGVTTWLLAPGIARRQTTAAIGAERPCLKVVLPGWETIGPYLMVFNVGGRQTTVTEVGWYAADGSVGGPTLAMWEPGVNIDLPEAVDAYNPPRPSYLPRVIEAGGYIMIPLVAGLIRDILHPWTGEPERGLSGFWVKEADETVTEASIPSEILARFISWLEQPPRRRVPQ